jgi:hypothetical protein
MTHDTVLIATVAIGIAVAFVFGLIAARIGLPPIVGYLLAGVAIGPFTPGYVADAGLARQLADLGVILLMFGVGLHFSLGDLMTVRRVVVPGALIETTVTSTIGVALGRWWGWGWGGAIVLGLALGVAGTVVLLKGSSDMTSSTQRSAESPSAGWWSRTSRWCARSSYCPPSRHCSAVRVHRQTIPALSSCLCCSPLQRSLASWHSWPSSAGDSCRGCSDTSRGSDRASCSRWLC